MTTITESCKKTKAALTRDLQNLLQGTDEKTMGFVMQAVHDRLKDLSDTLYIHAYPIAVEEHAQGILENADMDGNPTIEDCREQAIAYFESLQKTVLLECEKLLAT